MEETVFISLFQSINVVFIAIVCLTTYGINNILTKILKKEPQRNIKSIISLVIGIITMFIYIKYVGSSIDSILLSFLICTFGYDLILKPIFKRFKTKGITNN